MTDLEALDIYLSSDASPDNAMQLSDLDGFMTGIVCSPTLIPPSEWLAKALGTSEKGTPPEIASIVLERYNEIVAGLNGRPPVLEPIFWHAKEGHVIAMDWCEGFMDAFHLREAEWEPLLSSPQGRDHLFPILAHLMDDEGASLIGVPQESLDAVLDEAADNIPTSVPRIYQFWRQAAGNG